MEFSKYILCNLPVLRQITICDSSVLKACVESLVLKEEQKDEMIGLDVPLRNVKFWNTIMNTKDSLGKLITIFLGHGQEEVKSILQKAHRNDHLDQEYMFVNNLKPLKIQVKKSEANFCTDDAYKLESPGIGIVLIINVLSSEKYSWSQYGSKQDITYLTDLWSQMGYKVIKREGEYKNEELFCIIKELNEIVYKNEYCMSFIIYIRCYGKDGNLIMSDGTEIRICQLLGYLGLELNVGIFKLKPKFFIIQVPGSISKRLTNVDYFQKLNQNTMICYLSEPDRHQELNVNVGSWLLYNLIDIFMREAYAKDLQSMLEEMWKNIFGIFGSEANQLVRFKNYGLKKLYFNVCIKEKMEYLNYFTMHTPYLSAICRKQASLMETIINDCVREHIFTQEDRINLIKNNNDISTSFWKLVPTKENYLNKLRDIFYNHKMLDVVDTINKAKKDDGSDTKYRAIEGKKPLVVKVKKPEVVSRKRKLDHYSLQEEFIGLALVINIIEYDECGLRRHGAEYDTTYMTELWSQMGYKVTRSDSKINKQDFMEIIDKFLTKMQTLNKLSTKKGAESCIVYIGCHGADGELIMSNGDKINLYEEILVPKFKGRHLEGVPKIFILQCCQIYQSEYELNMNRTMQKKVSNMKDLILCFSTLRGEPSNRDCFVGSLYVYALTYVFMNNAHNMDLQKMLYEVARYMCTEFNFDDENQMPYIDPYDMKNLYFNVRK